MSRLRLSFIIGLILLGSYWSVTTLWAQSIRLHHRALILSIRTDTPAPPTDNLDHAIADYARAMRYIPCNLALHTEHVLLHAKRADTALASPDLDASAAALDQLNNALTAKLACMPDDGKAWLDLATISVLREGFTDNTIDAFAHSASVAPGESWLAKKRLLFALRYRPLLDNRMHAIALHDLTVLDNAHPIHLKALRKAAAVDSNEALRALFETNDPQK